MVLSYLAVAGMTHSYVLTAARAALDGLIFDNAEGVTTSAGRHVIIKKTLFMFRKKFATTVLRRTGIPGVVIVRISTRE